MAFLHGPKLWITSKGNSLEHAGKGSLCMCAMYRTDGQCFHSSVMLGDDKLKCQQQDTAQQAWKVVSLQQTLLHNNDSIRLHKWGRTGFQSQALMKGLAHTFALSSCHPVSSFNC